MVCLLILLGGLLFNLDRLSGRAIRNPSVRRLIPYQLRCWLPGGGALEGRGERGRTLTGQVIRVYDGDTATLLDPSGELQYKIRFYGMDAPEKDQAHGPESARALARLIEGQQVRVEVTEVDRYNRSVGKVYRDDLYVNLAMVLEGNAWWYAAYAAKDGDLEAAERDARRARRGLWQSPDPAPPWEFRRMQTP